MYLYLFFYLFLCFCYYSGFQDLFNCVSESVSKHEAWLYLLSMYMNSDRLYLCICFQTGKQDVSVYLQSVLMYDMNPGSMYLYIGIYLDFLYLYTYIVRFYVSMYLFLSRIYESMYLYLSSFYVAYVNVYLARFQIFVSSVSSHELCICTPEGFMYSMYLTPMYICFQPGSMYVQLADFFVSLVPVSMYLYI